MTQASETLTIDDLLDRMQVVALQPDDTVIFQVQQVLTKEETANIRATIIDRLDPPFRFLVVDSRWSLRILRPTE